MSLNFQRTRLAPTPSGYLHLGNILSFVLTAGLARKYGASILLRIDDMDQERVRIEYLDDIFDTLQFLEIPWDEGPRNTTDHIKYFSQLHRLSMYQEGLDNLISKHLVFACSCSRSSSEIMLNNFAYPGTCLNKNLEPNSKGLQLRFITNKEEEIRMHELIAGKISDSLSPSMAYFQVRKKNGDPSYQLTSLLDDLHYGVDLIVRGNDLLDSSFVQLSLAKALDKKRFLDVRFLHHPLLKTDQEEKLSKSAGATSIQFLRKSGLDKQAIFQIMAKAVGIDASPSNWLEIYDLLAEKWVALT
jgi:glutamyl/glutaminyl-tRNA synthetase